MSVFTCETGSHATVFYYCFGKIIYYALLSKRQTKLSLGSTLNLDMLLWKRILL